MKSVWSAEIPGSFDQVKFLPPNSTIQTTNNFAIDVSILPAKRKPAANFVFAASRSTVENRESAREFRKANFIFSFSKNHKFTGDVSKIT